MAPHLLSGLLAPPSGPDLAFVEELLGAYAWICTRPGRGDGATPAARRWFSGQIWPGSATTSLTYEFDFPAPGLAVRGKGGALTPAQASEAESGPGLYTLAVRLRHEYQPNQRRAVHYIPVLRITVSETGQVSYQVHEDAGGVKPVR